jgi:hypothetical protein
MAIEREVLVDRPVDPFVGMRISWGGVFSGVLAGIGTLLLLTALGVAIGVSAIDPNNPDGGAVGTGAAIWTALSLLIALFVGGWASTRLSMLWERTTAMFEGVLVWVLSMVLILYLAANGIGIIVSGATRMLGGMAQTAAPMAMGADIRDLTSGNVDQMLAKLDDPQTATRLAAALNLPQDQVAGTLSSTRQRVAAVRDDPTRAAQEMRQGLEPLTAAAGQRLSQTAEQVKPEATATAWISFLALLLSLLAAVGGAAVGRRNVRDRVAPRIEP